jgi:hypothetical protein
MIEKEYIPRIKQRLFLHGPEHITTEMALKKQQYCDETAGSRS